MIIVALHVDALSLFVFVSLLVGAGAYACLRFKLDVITWATMSAASLPPAIYFTLRAGGDLALVVEVVVIVGMA